jgi:hypothetical protein
MDASFSFEGRTYRPQVVRCGKPGCKTCARKGGHGPYWYAFWKVKARTVSRYIGKVLPPGVVPPATAKAAPPGWRAQRCTDEALRVAMAAWQAADYGQLYPEHLLLALARSEEGLGARALHALGVTEATLRPLLIGVTLASMNVSGRKLAGLAASEARRWHDPLIGTEHLLLAVLRLVELPIVAALSRQGATLDRAINGVTAVRGLPDAGKRCAACRKPLRAAWQFCPHCGIARARPDAVGQLRASSLSTLP